MTTVRGHDCPVIRTSRGLERRANVQLGLFVLLLLALALLEVC